MIVATVLKSGGTYISKHVHRLHDQVCKYTPCTFICLTDVDDIEYSVPLFHNWPGWWSKIELFRPNLFAGRVVYIDLDTTVRGDLREFIREDFTMINDFYKTQEPASGMMAWKNQGPGNVYEVFKKSPYKFIDMYRKVNRWGDQGFIRDHAGKIDFFNDIRIVSHKVHCKEATPEDAIVVCFHGTPKPWDVGQ